ncbi:ECF-type sigma factor [Novipirellula artificiosorum]|uniref:ECF sigma factor n=1 Tax=Novipirellula artificiosorum TaxID=2528016 RepID=A0A5C6DAF7_9BACT|nr:ECF-type sigma factor [Novipirellula artificiosorum]TWU33872.1 ECF sigma factor [Novipirellula artificiosorum]
MSDDPITEWIGELRGANEAAADKIWNHYWTQLCAAARRKLRSDSRPLYDEEDAALSAFNSFANGLAAGRFPKLNDRESLLRLLLVITGRKVRQRHRYDQQQKRDVRQTMTGSVFMTDADDAAALGVNHIKAREPTPEFVASFTETCDRFFKRLGDPQLQEIAVLRMEGYNDGEIAKHLDCSRSTVQRRLEIVRRECLSFDENDV